MNARRRIAFLVNDLARAGAETQLVALATGLSRDRYEVEIILVKERNDFSAELAAAAIPVTPLRRRGPGDVAVAYRLYRTLRRRPPDILHSYLFFSNLMACLVARRARVPVLIVSQRASYDRMLPPFWRRVARWCHRRADRVIVNAEATRAEELAAGGDPDRHVTIPNGVPVPCALDVRRTDLGLPEGLLVVCLGQLSAFKGHDTLLHAWPHVLTRSPDARLALVGDGAFRRNLERQAARLGVAGSVSFLGHRHPAAPYLAAADLVVQPSTSEGMPNAVLEAMASGRAVVATRAGGTAEVVLDGETGRLVRPGDARALAAAIGDLLADPGQRSALGAAGRRRVETRFTTAAMVTATEAVYAAGRRSAAAC